MVDMPSVKAKPFTSADAKKYRIAAARNETVSADRIVRRARTHARGTATRTERPSCTSSLMRSKNTTKESAVMPSATMKPAMPARSRVKPIWLPSTMSIA
jgi:hypothetical protein